MSARRLLALLVVVALGLLLMCPAALSRHPLTDVSETIITTNPNDDDPDPDIPNGHIDGDDDNWDKSAVKGHSTAEPFGGSGEAGTEEGTSGTEDVISRMEISLSARLALLLQSWVIFSALR